MWCNWGKDNGYDYMIVMCDTTVMEDYPVYCMENEFDDVFNMRCVAYKKEVREVYDFTKSIDLQIAARRVMNMPRLRSGV